MKQLIDIADYLEHLTRAVKDEEQDPFEALGVLRTLASACSAAMAEVDEVALAKADALGGKEFSGGGFRFRKNDGRVSWKYDGVEAIKAIQDSIKVEQERAKLALKLAQKAGLPDSGIHIVDGYVWRDGEAIGQPATEVFSKASLTLVKE